jgi:hypothetical protein
MAKTFQRAFDVALLAAEGLQRPRTGRAETESAT